MKKIIRKLYFNYEKEEKWLNEMSALGLAFTDYSLCRYEFETCEPGKYLYRIELLENLPSHPESQSYIEFMEETGVEHVGSYVRWVYFRKRASEGSSFDIYSDANSRIKHYKRLVRLYGTIVILNLIAIISNTVIYYYNKSNITSFPYIVIPNLILTVILGGLCMNFLRRIKKLKKEKLLRE